MNNLGSFMPGDVVTDKFTTVNLSGVPASITGGVVRVYRGGSTAPLSGGVSLVPDFAGNTGSNFWAVDTNADPPAYLSVAGTSGANQYTVELSSGAVAGFPVRGYQIGKFTLGPQGAVTGVSGSVGSVQGTVGGTVGGVVGNIVGNLSGTVGSVQGSVGAVVSGVNVSQWLGATVTGTSGWPRVNLGQWLGIQPAPLIATLVQTQVSGTVATGTTVEALTSAAQDGIVNRYLNTSRTVNTVSGTIGQVFATLTVSPDNFNAMSITSAGRVNVNLQEWLGVAPAPLNAARVQTFQSGNVIGSVIGDVSGSVGFVQAAIAASLTSAQAGDVAARVWGIPRTAATVSGSFGQSVLVQNGVLGNITGSLLGDVSGTVGSVQGAVASTFTSAQAADIAERVWDTPRTAATTSGSFGQGVLVTGLIPGGTATFYDAVADALLDRADAIESSLTPRQAIRGIAATQLGRLSGGGTGAVGIWGAGVNTTRVSAVATASGNRTTVTLNL